METHIANLEGASQPLVTDVCPQEDVEAPAPCPRCLETTFFIPSPPLSQDKGSASEKEEQNNCRSSCSRDNPLQDLEVFLLLFTF